MPGSEVRVLLDYHTQCRRAVSSTLRSLAWLKGTEFFARTDHPTMTHECKHMAKAGDRFVQSWFAEFLEDVRNAMTEDGHPEQTSNSRSAWKPAVSADNYYEITTGLVLSAFMNSPAGDCATCRRSAKTYEHASVAAKTIRRAIRNAQDKVRSNKLLYTCHLQLMSTSL